MVRARVSQEFLGYLDEYQAGLRDQVQQLASTEYLETLATVPPNTWIPFELSCSGVEAAIDVLGEERALSLWRNLFTQRFMKTPIIGGLINSWIRIFGLSPGTVIKAVPKGFEGTYRDVAQVHLEHVESDHGRVSLLELAPQMLAHPKYWIAWRGTFEGVFELCSIEGRVDVDVDEADRTARFDWRW